MGEQVATLKQANTETPPEWRIEYFNTNQLYFLYIVPILHFTIYYLTPCWIFFITLFQQLFRIYHHTFRATLSISAGGLSVVQSAIVLK